MNGDSKEMSGADLNLDFIDSADFAIDTQTSDLSDNGSKVLFIVPPEKFFIESYVTRKLDKGREFRQKLGILYVAGSLREGTTFDVDVVDSLADGLDSSDIRRIIKEKKPDVVGFSVLTFNLLDCLDVAKIIREVSPSTKICFGGFHPTIYPQETLDFPEVDYIVFGEGETTFKELVKIVDLGGDLDSKLGSVDGIGWKNSFGMTFINKARKAAAKLDEITMPAHDLIDLEKYTVVLANDSKVASIQSSRGCPSKCTFCDIRLTRFRFRSAENVLEELVYLKSRGINEFFLVDDQFTSNKERVLSLCKLLIDKDLGIKFKISSRIDRVDSEMLNLLGKAGCYRIHYGIESGSQRLLDYMEKEITLDQIRQTVKNTKKVGIEVFAYMMIGIPTETKEDIKKSVNLIRELKPNHVNYSICTPFPKTALYERALEQEDEPDDYWLEFAKNPDPNFKIRTLNDNFSESDLRMLQDKALRSFYSSPAIIYREVVTTKSFKQLFTKAKIGLRLLIPRLG
jgi:anaerobic magnesium-protoporphyrin IX monomethyl ester cyclase